MYDVSGLPPLYRSEVRRYDAIDASSGAGTWQQWVKPRGCSMVWMMAMGSGSGGGGGFSGADATARGGGGGGGSSAICTMLIPAIFLPDILYVAVGVGGAGGGGTGQQGISNQRTFISQAPPLSALTQGILTTDNNIVLQSGAGTGGGGVAGNGVTGTSAAGGGAESATVISNERWLASGIFQAYVGSGGAQGGAGGNNPGNTIPVPVAQRPQNTGGGGGGSCTSANQIGGSLVAGPYLPSLGAGTAGVSNGAGPNGWSLTSPLYSCGGAGGASVTAGTGGAGGRGGQGCGGGGGGAGVTGGAGGQGGNGVAFIISW